MGEWVAQAVGLEKSTVIQNQLKPLDVLWQFLEEQWLHKATGKK